MDFIKTVFTINDMENLSGIKKHTIRIWEKRYNLLSPERTDTNIRYYSISSLKHLLNIVLLYNNDYKISKIAQFAPNEIIEHCQKILDEKLTENHILHQMKVAMLSFDQQLFEQIFQKLNLHLSFSEIFQNYFIPFLQELGWLWQTEIINPAHEHFISNLMRQKILVRTEKLLILPKKNQSNQFVLFLPDNEVHDIGIIYLNYELLNREFCTVFLGQSVPIDCLNVFSSSNNRLIFISYFTVQPEVNNLSDYLEKFYSTILHDKNIEFWILGQQVQYIKQEELPLQTRTFTSLVELLAEVGNFEAH